MNLLQALQNHSALAFHMPGHKRRSDLLGGALPYAIDVTEIDGFDNLQAPTGVLRDIMERAGRLWGSDGAYLSVNGSSGAILAGVRALTRRGDTVLVARNCHMSVFHAVELCGLRPVLLEPQWLPAWGMYGAVGQAAFDAARMAHPEASLCVLTNPTYEGVFSEIITDLPLLVDGAHGAHLPLPAGDIVVQSLHKTLPALTQTALLHVRGERVDRQRLEHQLRVFQSSSPSYVLLASIGECVALLERHHAEWRAAWDARLDGFYSHALRWKRLRACDMPGRDRGKLLLRCDAQAAAVFLRTRGIEPEYAQENRLLLMTSFCDSEDMLRLLLLALDELDIREELFCGCVGEAAEPLPAGELVLTPGEAVELPWEEIPAEQAAGRVCAEYIWRYPPGIPLLLPGQRVIAPPAGQGSLRVLKRA